jgi:PAS domain S-box-containing protein
LRMEKIKLDQNLLQENEFLRLQLEEANDIITAIRNGEIDALVVESENGHELFTLNSADRTYRNFIEQMSEGAITLNSNGIIVYCNSSFASMAGKHTTEIVSFAFSDFVHPSSLKKYEELISVGWLGEVKGEIQLLAAKDTVPVQLSMSSLKMDEGMALSVIVTDLTAQKQILDTLKLNNEQLESINQQLELSNHDLQQFASVASHDLQEPLRKIQVFSHLLKEKFATDLPETASAHLNKIVHAANRMKALIIDILNYSRLSSNDRNYVKTDVKAMINELLVDLELIIKEKNAVISVGYIPNLEINPGQMRQVFQNLISNALKFCKRNVAPIIDIYCEPRSVEDSFLHNGVRHCNIYIRDNGIGFNEKYVKTIFNLFEKLHSKDDYDGSGIGLAITKKIIEKHNGQISVRSEEGVGTEFILTLPMEQKEQ